jgi:hypothetical protein
MLLANPAGVEEHLRPPVHALELERDTAAAAALRGRAEVIGLTARRARLQTAR